MQLKQNLNTRQEIKRPGLLKKMRVFYEAKAIAE